MATDRYMNLFEHYRQEGTIPHENNLSRGLAILLNENPLFFDGFIDLANSKLSALEKKPLRKPEGREDREIGFQRNTKNFNKDFPFPQRIIGFTLTPDRLRENAGETQAAQPVREYLVTDIVVFCGEDLLILEVKKTPGNSAGDQVTAQAHSIRSGREDVEVISPLCLTWEEVLQTLQNIQRLQGEARDPILEHYLKYLDASYQEWFPVMPFGKAAETGFDAVKKRTKNLAEACFRLFHAGQEPGEAVYWNDNKGVVVPLKASEDYIREFHLYPCEEGSSFTHIQIVLWPGNNIGQAHALFEAPGIRDDMSWTLEKSIEVDKTVLETTIMPYLKFSHIMGKFIMEAYGSPDFWGTQRPSIHKKIFTSLAKLWKRKEWPELLDFLSSKNSGLLKSPGCFKEEFQRKIEESNREFVVVTPGYKVVITIPASKLSEMDREPGFKDDDKAARLIVQAVESLRGKIETLAQA